MSIIIHDVGLRDGLQIEKTIVPTEVKIQWTRRIIDAGVKYIQLGSFVHPERVPQMADSDELFRFFSKPENKPDDVIFSGLVLNEKGLERGLACGVDLYCVGVSASETHSQKNTGMGTKEALDRIIKISKRIRAENRPVQVSVQSAFGCGFEGEIKKEKVLDIIKAYFDAGFTAINIADTAGQAHPDQVTDLFGEILKLNKQATLVCHFHNAYGMSIANCYAAYKVGVTYFESAVAGLGGCPFTAVTSGNVCTEDLVYLMQRMDQCQDINVNILIEVAKTICTFLKRDIAGSVSRVGHV